MLSTTPRPSVDVSRITRSRPVRALLRILGELTGVIAVAFVALLWGLVRVAVSLLERFFLAANGISAGITDPTLARTDPIGWVAHLFSDAIGAGIFLALVVALALIIVWLCSFNDSLGERVTKMLHFQWLPLVSLILAIIVEHTQSTL